MEKLPGAGSNVKIVDAPEYYKHLIGKVGTITHTGISGETVAVSIGVGQEVYFTKEQLEAA